MNVIVIGCGRVGSELARSLAGQGHAVAVVDRNPQAFGRLGSSFPGRTVRGDVMDQAVLRRAGIHEALGFAAVTPSDETNLVASKTARDIFHIPHIVARIYDPSYEPVFRHAGLETVASSLWGARRVEQALLQAGVVELESLNGDGLRLIEVRVPAAWAGKTLGDLARQARLRPAALLRGASGDLADPEASLAEGDRVIAAARASDLETVRAAVLGGGG
jgi:trk system potassium uptake protein TrkA